MVDEAHEWPQGYTPTESDAYRIEASQMMNVLSVQAADADPDVITEARRRLLLALDALMDFPAYSDIHGNAQRLLANLAERFDRPDWRIPDERY